MSQFRPSDGIDPQLMENADRRRRADRRRQADRRAQERAGADRRHVDRRAAGLVIGGMIIVCGLLAPSPAEAQIYTRVRNGVVEATNVPSTRDYRLTYPG